MPTLLMRLRILGVVLAACGVATAGVGFLYGWMTASDGLASAQAIYEDQGVELSYNDAGQLVDGNNATAAQDILDRLAADWKYPVNHKDLDPKDPVVNTRTELMYEYATITTHVLDSKVAVVLNATQVPITYRGVTYDAPGTYNITVEKYYAQMDRSNPIEAQLRNAWSPLALSLLGALAGGHANQAAGELARATTLGFTGIGLLFALGGAGLFWASYGRIGSGPAAHAPAHEAPAMGHIPPKPPSR
jgi:hypothetical protein